ncbi:restriction endonuclease subunit S [Palleniella muris]|uniref:Restriction endonuclease subunit S n=1 Tax=Palleniella muris TaxID=3038145 RepID=A0AC61QQE0_9BACT|nr:restriction endonuclease subunit S [Palleniella muris]TGX82202.1 restriction endonuclease subunit S [Palleniella muris]
MDAGNVKWVRIGDYIEQCDERNSANVNYPVIGINRDKTFMPTVANLDGVDIAKYKIITKGMFVFSGMQTGRDICIRIGLYDNEQPALVSPAYTTFVINDDKKVLPEYLFMYFNRDESDRYGWFISDSSVRANLDWPRFLDIEIPLPSPNEQQKVVNAWKAFREIKEQNEAKAAPLMQVCQSYIQKAKKNNADKYRIGNAIKIVDTVNKDGHSYEVLGLNSNKVFMPTIASMDTINTSKYKVIRKGEFAFSGMQTGRDKCIRIALYEKDTPALISPAYTTFALDENEPILPEYFMMIFKNSEMDRLGWFYSDSSVRANLDWDRFIDIEIPLLPIELQRAIVNIYKCANEAKQIAEDADRLSREVCPALLQHVIHS